MIGRIALATLLALTAAVPAAAQTSTPGVPAAGAVSPRTPPARGAGADEAVLEIVEFSDFQCPYCAMAAPVVDSLVAGLGNRVRVVYRHYPLPMHDHAERAAQAAVEAQRQGAFWEYHDVLFRNQERLTDADLVGYADSVGLDAEAMRRALKEGWHSEAVARDRALGRSLAVTGTPTFFVNGYRVVGAPPVRVIEEAVRAFEKGIVEPRAPGPVGPPR